MFSKPSPVYLHRTVSRDRHVLETGKLFSVLTLNWLFDPLSSGIAPELVEKLYDDHGGLRIAPSDFPSGNLNIVYISVEDPEEAVHLMGVLPFMNGLPHIAFTIYCSKTQEKMVGPYANEHISFLTKRRFPNVGLQGRSVPLSFHGVMTFGTGALHFLRQGNPVWIAGPYGWGGLVDTGNFHDLAKRGFMGRPGASYGEPIPLSIVQEQFSVFLKRPPDGEMRSDLKKLAEQEYGTPLSEAKEKYRQAKQKKRTLYHPGDRWALRPKLASNIELIDKDGNIYCQRRVILDTLAIMSAAEKDFLTRMDGRTTCSELCRLSGMKRPAFWTHLYTMREQNIIVF